MGSDLRSGASGDDWSVDGDDRAERRAERRAHEDAVDEYWAKLRGVRRWNEDGLRVEPHRHDVLPIEPARRPDPHDVTGRHAYEDHHSPLVVITPRCSAEEGCTARGMPRPMREDSHRAIMEAGGFRCDRHPRPPADQDQDLTGSTSDPAPDATRRDGGQDNGSTLQHHDGGPLPEDTATSAIRRRPHPVTDPPTPIAGPVPPVEVTDR